MSRRTARLVAGVVVVASLGGVAASIPLSLTASHRIESGRIVLIGDPSTARTQEVLRDVRDARAAGDPLTETTSGLRFWTALVFLALGLWLGVGFLIVSKQPTSWAGWLFLITGAPLPIAAISQQLVIRGAKVDPGSVPWLDVWATLGDFVFFPIALLPMLFLLYPDGHPPSRRWRWAAIGLVGGTALAFLGFVFRPGPFNTYLGDGILYVSPLGIDAFAEIGPAVILMGGVIALLCALSTVVAVRQRYRRSRGDERQQMRWLAFVASLAGVWFVFQWVVAFAFEAGGFDPAAPVFDLLFALTAFTIVLGVPIAYLVAIFKHGLWNLDVVIKKAVLFATFALLLIGIFLALAVTIGNATIEADPFTVSALVALGAALWPGIRLARRVAARVVYGRRATPYEVLTEFSHRLGGSYASEDVLPKMAAILRGAVAADRATVWLRVGDELRPAGVAPLGEPLPRPIRLNGHELPKLAADAAVEVRDQGELLGALAASTPANDPMNPSKERLIHDLAAQAGLVLRNVRLIEELRASRQRLVAAQDEERRRIERNIHDGAQQQLVALIVKLRLADGMVERQPGKARDLLAQLQSETNEALEDLRDLARGIYPPLLADQGLASALEAQARRSPIPVRVEPGGIRRYQPEAEAAVYFCCLEALQNIAKYAGASAATIQLAHADGRLTFTIVDDGLGFDAATTSRGTGLQGMADRMDAIGGTLEVTSAPGEGTTVSGAVPVEAGMASP